MIRKSALLVAMLLPSRGAREWLRERADDVVIALFRPEIEGVISRYPSVRREEDTLESLIAERCALARFGDGELKLMVGERHKSFQDVNAQLNARLAEVLRSRDPKVRVAIHPVRSFSEEGRIWRKFMIRIGEEVLALFDGGRVYDSTGVFHRLPDDSLEVFESRVKAIKQLWDGRRVLIVVGKGSRFHFEEELFDNVASVDYVHGPPKNAFANYDQIMQDVRKYDPEEYLVLLVLGPTATVMAYDLGREGYQAIDFGQMPGKYRSTKKRILERTPVK